MSSMTMHAGEDRTIDVSVLLRGRQTSIDGATLVWTVQQDGSTLFQKSTPTEIEITDAAEGDAVIHVLDSDTSSLTERALLTWEFEVDGTRVAEGHLLVLP